MKNIEEKIAVTLKYKSGDYAPIISAKAKGVLAEKILQLAKENNVPVIENDLLSNVLLASEIDECIPEEIFEEVAKIFAVIQNIENKIDSK